MRPSRGGAAKRVHRVTGSGSGGARGNWARARALGAQSGRTSASLASAVPLSPSRPATGASRTGRPTHKGAPKMRPKAAATALASVRRREIAQLPAEFWTQTRLNLMGARNDRPFVIITAPLDSRSAPRPTSDARRDQNKQANKRPPNALASPRLCLCLCRRRRCRRRLYRLSRVSNLAPLCQRRPGASLGRA